MTGAAHFAVGAGTWLLTRNHALAATVSVLSHPALDLAGAWHPRDLWKFDTLPKKAMCLANVLFFAGTMVALMLSRNWWAILYGFAALWADLFWAINWIWPGTWNPHKYWWLKGKEFREWLPAFWYEMAIIAAGYVLIAARTV